MKPVPKIVLATCGGAALIVLLTVAGAAWAVQTYNGKILPGVSVGGVALGGLTREQAEQQLQEAANTMIAKGLPLTLNGRTITLPLVPEGATDPDLVYPLLDVDVSASVERAYRTGRTSGLNQWFGPLVFPVIRQKNLVPDMALATERFAEAVRAAFPTAETPGTPTDYQVDISAPDYRVNVTPPTAGVMIDFAEANTSVLKDATDFSLQPLHLKLVERSGVVSVAEAEALIPSLRQALDRGDITLSANVQDGQKTYRISKEELADWILPERTETNEVTLSIASTAFVPLITAMRADLDQAERNAEFVVEGNRVTTFVPSLNGQRVDEQAVSQLLRDALRAGTTELTVPLATTEPDITTAEANTFGISEKLGTGYSNYKGSPTNRRANIAHGASKINGILIAPGETFSLLAALRPFTIADGYLPELVIKGDEIKPEIGGGLCQIGSTTFRAAMNSGLHIAERRNHSLVVSYYNDPSNGNPGTDATIYDPAPDLKITNDTGNYILLETENHTDTSELFFNFWGTNDGRKGYYTPPKVLNWVGHGPTVYKETDTLPAGKQQCQGAHPGANTAFTYVIERPDGTKNETEFTSSYRPLPQICLVGKADATVSPGAEVVTE